MNQEYATPFPWTELILLLIAFVMLTWMFNAVMRRILSVEKRKMFSRDYINSTHERGEKVIRILSVIGLLASSYISPAGMLAVYVGVLFWVIDTLYRIFIELIFVEEKKEAFYTLSELTFSLTMAITIFNMLDMPVS